MWLRKTSTVWLAMPRLSWLPKSRMCSNIFPRIQWGMHVLGLWSPARSWGQLFWINCYLPISWYLKKDFSKIFNFLMRYCFLLLYKLANLAQTSGKYVRIVNVWKAIVKIIHNNWLIVFLLYQLFSTYVVIVMWLFTFVSLKIHKN